MASAFGFVFDKKVWNFSLPNVVAYVLLKGDFTKLERPLLVLFSKYVSHIGCQTHWLKLFKDIV